MSEPLVLFGGTFDPIHVGHIKLMEQLHQELNLSKITFLPCSQSTLKEAPQINNQHRLEMLKIAVEPFSYCQIDERELKNEHASPTFDTLKKIRQELGEEQPIIFIIGMDNLVCLDKWSNWQELTKLCHFLVIHRPGFTIPLAGPVAKLIQDNLTQSKKDLFNKAHGSIYIHPTALFDISSTKIRDDLHSDEDCSDTIAPEILKYINENNLYQ